MMSDMGIDDWQWVCSDHWAQVALLKAWLAGPGGSLTPATEDPPQLEWAVDELGRRGLTETVLSGDMYLRPSGEALARRVAQSYADGGQLRQDAALWELLRRLKTESTHTRRDAAGAAAVLDEPLVGGRFTAEEIEEAAARAGREGLAKILPTWGRTLIDAITPAGRSYLLGEVPAGTIPSTVHHYDQRDQSVSIGTNYGNVATGEHITQQSASPIPAEVFAQLTSMLEAAADLPDDENGSVHTELHIAQENLTRAEPDVAGARAALARVGARVWELSNSPALGTIVAGLPMLLQALS